MLVLLVNGSGMCYRVEVNFLLESLVMKRVFLV